MGKKYLNRLAALMCFILILGFVLSDYQTKLLPAADDPKPAPKGSSDIFGLTKVWSIQLDISEKEYESMQPAIPAFPGPGGPPQPKAKKEVKEKRDSERNLFGTEFPWAEGAL